MHDNEERRDDIIRAARKAGLEVTRTRLRRWRRAGLLGKADQRGRGRGAGSETFYPAGTRRRVLLICELLPQHRAFPELAWELFMRHEDVRPSLVLKYLRSIADVHDRVLAKARTLGFDRPEISPEALEVLHKVAGSRYVPKRMRENVAEQKELRPGRIETLMRTSVQIMLGSYDPNAAAVLDADDSDGVILTRALGLDPARIDIVLDQPAWLPEDPSDQLKTATRLLGGDWVPLVNTFTIEELGAARDLYESFRTLALSVGDSFRALFQSNLAGFPALASVLHEEDSEGSALGVLGFVQIMRMPELGLSKGLEQLLCVTPKFVGEAVPAMRAMQILRDEHPEFALALSPERLREVISSRAAFDANTASLIPLAEKNRAVVLDAMKRAGMVLPDLEFSQDASTKLG